MRSPARQSSTGSACARPSSAVGQSRSSTSSAARPRMRHLLQARQRLLLLRLRDRPTCRRPCFSARPLPSRARQQRQHGQRRLHRSRRRTGKPQHLSHRLCSRQWCRRSGGQQESGANRIHRSASHPRPRRCQQGHARQTHTRQTRQQIPQLWTTGTTPSLRIPMAAAVDYHPHAHRPYCPPRVTLSVPCRKGDLRRLRPPRPPSRPLSSSRNQSQPRRPAETITDGGRILTPAGDHLSQWQTGRHSTRRSTTRLAPTFWLRLPVSRQRAPSCHDRHRVRLRWSRCEASFPSAAGRGVTVRCGSAPRRRSMMVATRRIHVRRRLRPRHPSSRRRRSRQCASVQKTSRRCPSCSS